MNRGFAFLAAGFAVGLALTGCNQGGFSEKTNDKKANVFRYPIVTSPTSLDPAMVQDGDTIDAIQQVFEGLVGFSPDNKVVPILAEKWEVQDNGTSYVFSLKKDLKFSSGREVKAADFKKCFERACDPAFNSPTAATYLSDIVGVKERLAGKADEVKGYEVVDDYTIKIKIDKPRPYFLGKLTYPVTFVYDLEKLPDAKKEMATVDQMVGTGPYTFEQFVPEQILKLKANAAYHGGAPKVDGIERPVAKDAATRLQLFKNKEVDLVQLERQDIKAIEEDAELKSMLKFFNRPSVWYIGLNVDMYEPLKKKEMRQAIARAIDTENIVKNVLGGVNEKANGIVPPGVFGHRDNPKLLTYDPKAARELMAKAGYPEGKGLPEFTITFREARPDIQLVAAQVASDLKKNLNMNVKLQTMEWRSYLEKHNKSAIPFLHMRWAADYLDAENFLSTLLASYGPENKLNYKNPAYDALTAKADVSLDEAERQKLYGEAEDLVLDDAPFIPIYFQRDAELIRPRVEGLRESVFGHLPHTTVSLK
jgi:ABC-type oligopeptide transport system substrate-binding subunit